MMSPFTSSLLGSLGQSMGQLGGGMMQKGLMQKMLAPQTPEVQTTNPMPGLSIESIMRMLQGGGGVGIGGGFAT